MLARAAFCALLTLTALPAQAQEQQRTPSHCLAFAENEAPVDESFAAEDPEG